eukprot:906264-Rhodomonas_salina.1
MPSTDLAYGSAVSFGTAPQQDRPGTSMLRYLPTRVRRDVRYRPSVSCYLPMHALRDVRY